MKKGNVGVVFEILGKKLKDSVGRSVDYGLTGQDGVVHPSLTVSIMLCFTPMYNIKCNTFKSIQLY